MLMLRVTMAMSIVALPATALAQQAVQWRVEDGGNGHWYARTSHAVAISRVAFEAAAASVGAHPVMLESPEEELFVFENFGPSVLGITAPAGSPSFSWIADPGNLYSNWGVASCPWGPYPNNNATSERFVGLQSAPCPGSQGIATQWDDYSVGEWPSEGQIVLEWASDCNGDGVVDYGQILGGQLADSNADGIPDACKVDLCPGDVDRNGVVDAVDLTVLLGRWGEASNDHGRADTNRDGIVDALDLAQMLSDWGPCQP